MPRVGGNNVGAPSSRVDKFYEFSNPAPQEFDPENDTDFGDAINIPDSVIEYDQLESSKKGSERGASLRRQNDENSISSSSGKYAGKRASRADTTSNFSLDQDDDRDDGDQDDDDDNQDDDDDDEGGTIWGAADLLSSSNKSKATDSEGESENDMQASGSEEEDDDHVSNAGDMHWTGMAAQEADMRKAEHTRNQLLLWDELMAIRMLLQPVLTQAIRFPQLSDFDHYNKVDHEIGTAFEETSEDLAELMDDLISLQTTYLMNSNVPLPQSTSSRKRSRDSDSMWQPVHELNQCLNTHVGNVLDKWSGKMQVSSGKVFTKKFQSFNQGFMNQIESLFTDRDRLIKRTTHIKKDQPIFGKENQQEFDDEIYDDTDFYQVLLKELIATGTAGYGKSTNLSDAKRVKTKQHKDYLRNASKGRMIKYDVQEKLVHFMAPDEKPLACDWNLDEFFVNLFGQKTNPQSGP